MIMMIVYLKSHPTKQSFFANLPKASVINFTVTWEDLLYICY